MSTLIKTDLDIPFGREYDVTPDGERFLMILESDPPILGSRRPNATKRRPQLVRELERLVPTEK